MYNYYDRIVKCSRCRKDAIKTETYEQAKDTTMCLNCGYYECGNFSTILELSEVNGFRRDLGLKSLEKLADKVNDL